MTLSGKVPLGGVARGEARAAPRSRSSASSNG